MPVQVRIQADQPLQPVKPMLLGSNTPWVYGSEGLVDDKGRWQEGMLTKARDWSPPILRYMAGESLPGFKWRNGIGPLEARPMLKPAPGLPPQKMVFGTQEFLEACEALGSVPLIQINMYEGSEAELAKDAADWVRYTNKQPLVSRRTGKPLPKVEYWELGNEPYVRDSRNPDGKPNPEFFRPAQFGRRLSVVMAAMKAVDPTIKLGIPFSLDTMSGRPWKPNGELAIVVGEQLGYADGLLSALDKPQDVSFLALHFYMPLVAGEGGREQMHLLPSDDALYWGAAAGSETIRRYLPLVEDFWKHHPRTHQVPLPPFFVTEYNAFFTNARLDGEEIKQNAYVATQAGALFVADLIRVMSQDDRITAAMQWSLSNNWVFGAVNGDSGGNAATPHARPVFEVMQMGKGLLRPGSRLLPTSVSVELVRKPDRQVGLAQPIDGLPLAEALATRVGKTVKLLLINKDPRRPAAVTIALAGASLRDAGVAQLVTAGVFASADKPQATRVQTAKAGLDARGGEARWTMGPASVALMTLTLE